MKITRSLQRMVAVTGSKNVPELANCCEKSRYAVQFGLTPFVKDELITDVQKNPYFFKFYETTNCQVKKHTDGYVSFFSKS